MIRRPTRSTRTDTLFPYTTLFRSTEITDAPSWSGDSASLLYLSGGKLRLVPVAGGAPRTIPCRLTWANAIPAGRMVLRSEEHTSELQSLMRISYAVFCLKKKKTNIHITQ